MSEKVKVNIYMTPDMLAALKNLAALRDVPYAEIVRTAVREYVMTHSDRLRLEKVTISQEAKL